MAKTGHLACPTDVVQAPIAVVWKLLTNPAGWADFYDIRVLRVEPSGRATKGQRMLGESGPRWLHLGVMFEFDVVDEQNHLFHFDGQLPFGITVRESMSCIPIDAERCRVNYHCDFTYPSGWRGMLVRFFLGRGFSSGPADSLQRLKQAAEAEHRRDRLPQ